MAVGWSGNLVALFQSFGIQLPPQVTAPPGTLLVLYNGQWARLATIGPTLASAGVDATKLPTAHGILDLPAYLVIALMTTILVIGVRESANFNSLIVFIKVATVLTFVVIATLYLLRHPQVAAANWHPFIPPNQGSFGAFGWSGIARGAGVIFFAYIGFDAVSTAAQEAKNPQRDMPIGILGSLAICTVLYVALGLTLTGVVHYTGLNTAAPVAVGIQATGVRWGSIVVMLGTFAGLTTTMLVMLLGQSRVFFSMSRDGLLPQWAGQVHPRFRTPWISSIVVGFFVAILAGDASDRRTQPTHLHRHAAGLCHRVRRGVGSAGKTSRSAPSIQSSSRSLDPNPGDRNLSGPDGQPALDDVDPADRVADVGNADLLRLWTKAQPSTKPSGPYDECYLTWNGETVNVSASMIAASKPRGQRLSPTWGSQGLAAWECHHVHHDDQPCPHPPPHVYASQVDQSDHRNPRNHAVRSRRQRIHNVSAIQLAAGQQVQCGGKHTHPRRHRRWMQIDPAQRGAAMALMWNDAAQQLSP